MSQIARQSSKITVTAEQIKDPKTFRNMKSRTVSVRFRLADQNILHRETYNEEIYLLEEKT